MRTRVESMLVGAETTPVPFLWRIVEAVVSVRYLEPAIRLGALLDGCESVLPRSAVAES